MEKMKLFFTRFKTAFRAEYNQLFSRFTHHWLLWFLPLALFFLISGIFSQGMMFDLPVGYVDQNHSTLSRKIIREFNASPHAALINYDNQLFTAVQDLEKAKIYAILYIPPNFEAHVLAGKQAKIALYYNALFYSSGLYSVMDYAGLISNLNIELRPVLASKTAHPIPPLADIKFIYNKLYNPSSNAMYYQQFSAVTHLLQLFVVALTIHLLGLQPKRSHASYPAILGKLALYTFWYTVLYIVEIAIFVLISGAPVVGNPLYMVCVSFFYVMAAQSIGALMFTFTRSVLTAYSFIGMLVGLALTYSGIAMPIISMPVPAQIIAQIEPLTYALHMLMDILLRPIGFVAVLKTCGILLIYPLIITFLIRRKLVKRIHQQEVLT